LTLRTGKSPMDAQDTQSPTAHVRS
jgi:hypothetical protein